MSFFLGIDRMLQYVGYNMDVKNNNKMKDPAKNKPKLKPKILDNTRIQGIKGGKSEGCAVFIGVMFVASVVAYVAYGQFISGKDTPLSSVTINNDEIKIKNSDTDIKNILHSDTSNDNTVRPNDNTVRSNDNTVRSNDDTARSNDNTVRSNDDTARESLSPISYLLYISSTGSSSTYNAVVTIRIRCIRETTTISLYSLQHHIKKVGITSVDKTSDITVIKYTKEYHRLVLTLNMKLVVGNEYNLSIGFHGDVTEESKGMFVKKYQDGDGVERQMISAMFQFGRARHVFPCFDEPSYKTSFQIILQHSKSYSAISNMPVEKTVSMTSGLVETYFKKSPPMSLDHVSFVIAEYTYKEIIITTGLKIRLYAPKGRVAETITASKMIPSFIQYYEKMFGVSYALPKLDVVPMEMLSYTSVSPGLIFIPENIFLLNEDTKTLVQLESSARVLGQVLVKQLLVGSFTLVTSDVRLYESMVLHIGYQTTKHLYPSWDLESQFYLDVTNKALMEDASNFTEPIVSNTSTYDIKRRVLKGAAVWNMISQYVGKPTLKSIILSRDGDIGQQIRGKVNTSNFLDFITKNFPPDVVILMKSWFMHPGFPLVTMYPDVITAQYIFKQKLFIDEMSADANQTYTYKWQIPMFMRSMCTRRRRTIVFNKEREIYILPNCYLQKVNTGGSGFYRVKYSKTDTRKFIRLLNTHHTVLSAVDRASLIADAFEIARFNPQTILTALDFTTYLSKEHHYVPYKIALTQLMEIADLFNDTKMESYMKEYIQKKTRPVLLYLSSLKKHNHMQKKLIELLLKVGVTYDLYIAVYLQNIFLHWMISNSTIQPPHHLRELVFEVGIWRGSSYEWNYLFKYFQRIPSNAEKVLVLNALSVTKNKFYLKQLMDYADKCKQSSISCIQRKLKIWRKVCRNKNGGRKLVTDNFFRDSKYLFTKVEEVFDDLETFMLDCLGSGRTMADIIQVKTIDVGLLSQPSRILLEKVIERIGQRINLRKHNEYIGTWFKEKARISRRLV